MDMKNLLIFLPLFLTFNLFAQIKEQFVAESASNTTIVIKENRASDEDILAQNFNLDDYRVGDVIRITTATEEKEPRVVERAEKTAVKSSSRVKRKKKKSFRLFKRPLRGKRKVRKSSFRNCYRF